MEFSNCLLLPVRMYLHFLRVLSWFDTVGPNYDPLQDYSSVKIQIINVIILEMRPSESYWILIRSRGLNS